MLNLFQQLIVKFRLTQDLRLLQSNEDGQMLKQVQHDKSLMLGQVVLCETINKQLNKLKIKSGKKAKKQASCRTRFGIYPENECREGYSLFFNRKIFNKLVSSLRCLFVRYRNSTHAAFNAYAKSQLAAYLSRTARAKALAYDIGNFGMTPDISGVKACTAYGKCQSGRGRRFDAPQGLALQGLAQC